MLSSLRRMIRFARPYGWIMFFGLLTTILPVVMELLVPHFLRGIIDLGIRAGDMGAIWRGAGLMLGTALVGAVATLGQGYCRAHLSQGIAYDTRNELFEHIQRLSFANLDEVQTGQLMTRLSSDVDVVRMFLSAGLSLLLRALLMVIGSVVMLLILDWQLATIMLALLAVSAVILRVLVRTATPLFDQVQRKLSALNTIVQENLAGVEVVKAFVRERFEEGRFNSANRDYMLDNVKVGRLLALALPLLTLLTNLGMVAVLWFGGASVMGGRLTVGELVAFNSYLMIGMAPLLLLSNILTMISRAEASAARLFEVFDTQPAIQPVATPHAPAAVRGAVRFDQVSFGYAGGAAADVGMVNGDEAIANPAVHHGRNGPAKVNGTGRSRSATNGRGHQAEPAAVKPVDVAGAPVLVNGSGQTNPERNVLDDVSFSVKPGERIALLGATGSGKSTLVNLLPRFYDANGGAIYIDEVDVREWSPDALRSRIGTVLQDTTLFSGTVRQNIAYGRPNASLEEVIAAAKAAQAHDFIMAMEDGYDSRVEERGANLSGGQKQRIAIARALLIRPSILILDDSTSAVDMDTEVRIQEALDTEMAEVTTFVVAQRINSVLNADQIFVLEAGRIVARGSHRNLLETSPIYQEIYQSQLGDAAEEEQA